MLKTALLSASTVTPSG